MKCNYNQRKRPLPSDVCTMALKVAKESMALQVDAVVSRAWNEMLIAMEQAGRIDCIVYLNAYATDCNQGVRCRLVDYRISERGGDQ